MADAVGLGSTVERRAGSSPAPCTNNDSASPTERAPHKDGAMMGRSSDLDAALGELRACGRPPQHKSLVLLTRAKQLKGCGVAKLRMLLFNASARVSECPRNRFSTS